MSGETTPHAQGLSGAGLAGSSQAAEGAERNALHLLVRAHERLAARAGILAAGDLGRRSFCSEWSVAQVYSHLGSGAEIGALALSAAREGAAQPDPWHVWNNWDEKSPTAMVDDFAQADRAYLDDLEAAIEAVERGERVFIPIDGRPWPLILALTARLVELILHEWDVAVVDDVDARVDPEGARWVLAAFPLEVAAQAASPPVVARLASRAIDIEISDPHDRLRLELGPSGAALHRAAADGPGDAVLTLPDSGTWVRLISGRWRPEIDDVHAKISAGLPTEVLTELFPGF